MYTAFSWVYNGTYIQWGSGVRKGPRLCCVCFVFRCSFIICQLYKLTLPDPAQVPLQMRRRGGLFSFVLFFFPTQYKSCVWVFSRSALAGGPEIAHGGPVCNYFCTCYGVVTTERYNVKWVLFSPNSTSSFHSSLILIYLSVHIARVRVFFFSFNVNGKNHCFLYTQV